MAKKLFSVQDCLLEQNHGIVGITSFCNSHENVLIQIFLGVSAEAHVRDGPGTSPVGGDVRLDVDSARDVLRMFRQTGFSVMSSLTVRTDS